MENLLFFGLWAVILFMTMRAVFGALVMGHGSHGRATASSDSVDTDDVRWVPPEKDKDPVCGKTVKTVDAKPSIYEGRVFYFCSRECREVFEAAPHLHVGGTDENQPKQLETKP